MSREPTEDEIKTRAELILARPMSPIGRILVDVFDADVRNPEAARLQAIEELRKELIDEMSPLESLLRPVVRELWGGNPDEPNAAPTRQALPAGALAGC